MTSAYHENCTELAEMEVCTLCVATLNYLFLDTLLRNDSLITWAHIDTT